MRIFLDTEFTGLYQQAELISIGLAAENGEVFYAQLNDYDPEVLDQWVSSNVIPLLSEKLPNAQTVHTKPVMLCSGDTTDVSRAVRRWLRRFSGHEKVEIWADVLAWDWVLFCELMGGTFALPDHIHYIPRDLSTLMVVRGLDPDMSRESFGDVSWTHPALTLKKHHALYDALLERAVFEKIY